MAREFHLSPPGKGHGVSCDAEGAFIGAIPILDRLRKSGEDAWLARDCDELSDELGEYYGLPIDISSKAGGLRAIANALNEGNVARAQIAAVLLGIADPPPLSKRAHSRERMIKLIRDLHWSKMIRWDPDEHPRWPAGSPDSIGGDFAPKGQGDVAGDSVTSAFEAAGRASGYGAKTAQDDAPKVILAAADEDEKDPRFGSNYPPLGELIPQRLQQSPAGPPLQFLDNLLDISGPGDEANFEAAQLLERALLHEIHKVDPNYVYESLEPVGGLAAMSWEARRNVIYGLQADLAGAIYRVRGDIRPLQEVTFEFLQRATNAAYDEGVELYNAGKLNVRLSEREAIGNYMDGIIRTRLGWFFNDLKIPTTPDSVVRINRRAYNSADVSYRLPDVRVGDVALDVSLTAKRASDPQIKGFFDADFKPTAVVIIRPNQLTPRSSYIIPRPKRD